MTITQKQALAIARANNIEDTEFFGFYGNNDDPSITYDKQQILEWVEDYKVTWANTRALLG